MRKAWYIAWLAMVVLQVLTVWLGRHSFSRAPDAHDAVDREILELLKLTNAEWTKLIPIVPAIVDSKSGEEMLFKRESLILRLQDMEAALVASGSQVEVAGLFANWVENRSSGYELYPVHQYINRLLTWMEPYIEYDRRCVLQRLTLHPDERSGFPSLSFELAGEPSSMALSLLGNEHCAEAWRLNELDLYRPESEGLWWMRGSLSFVDGNFPQ